MKSALFHKKYQHDTAKIVHVEVNLSLCPSIMTSIYWKSGGKPLVSCQFKLQPPFLAKKQSPISSEQDKERVPQLVL
jgi:hypothetical protein